MALVAKCTGGKRVNFGRSISYTCRAYSAALSHADGPSWHLNAWKGNSSNHMIQFCLKRKRHNEQRRERIIPSKSRKLCVGPDSNYGPNASQPDMAEIEIEEKKIIFLQNLRDRISGDSSIQEIEMKTRGQHDNVLWREYRQDYLTSSNFGAVVKRRRTTPCHNLVKCLLYKKPINTPGVLYGRVNENRAIEIYEATKNVEVTRCGFIIDPDFPFLGASPDGLIKHDGLIEVKCLQSVKGKLSENKKSKCYTVHQDGLR